MSKMFANVLNVINGNTSLNVKILVDIRRIKMEQEGFDTSYINWDHYQKVLEAKIQKQATA